MSVTTTLHPEVRIRPGMWLYDLERQCRAEVRKIGDDFVELGLGKKKWRQSWEHVAMFCFQPDTPGAQDTPLAYTLGSNPYDQMANDAALLADRLDERVNALATTAAGTDAEADLEELQVNTQNLMREVIGNMERMASRYRLDWLRGRMEVPDPFVDNCDRPRPAAH